MGLLSRYCLLVVTMVVLLVPAALAQCAPTEEPDPCVDDCSVCGADSKVPNPDNCHGYFLCIDDADHYDLPFECDNDEVFVFNSSVQDCVKGAPCEPCDPGSSSFCVYECSASTTTDPVTIPSPTDCHNYYVCVDDVVDESITCEATKPFFDGEECQTEEARCCHCHAYCPLTTTDPGYIADPLDCRRYYFCTADDVGNKPSISGTCDEGENFDSFLQDCSASAECDTQCTNVVGPDGCIEPFTCETTGFFARCPGQCTPDYYHCTEATGEYQDVQSCSDGTFFHPNSHNCVSEGSCP